MTGREPLWIGDNPHNHHYLETKQAAMGHLAAEPEPAETV